MNEKALPNYRKPTNNKYRRKYGSKNKKSPFSHDQNNNSEKKTLMMLYLMGTHEVRNGLWSLSIFLQNIY